MVARASQTGAAEMFSNASSSGSISASGSPVLFNDAASSSPASTSSYAFESDVASSSSGSTSGRSSRRPSAPEVITGPDGGLIVVEHVVALHDFQSNNSTCLSFFAGQVIRVFNRDASGWWDGELDGQRGWFPSNYVDQEDADHNEPEPDLDDVVVASAVPSTGLLAGGAFGGKEHGTKDVDRANGYASYRGIVPHGRLNHKGGLVMGQPGDASTLAYTILDPIFHAIALLHNAVRANRVAHFQPSTACVISSVRSVLSATDCLTRESPVLRAHPTLARERKQILSVLSRLVTQARKASAPMTDESVRGHEMESMLRHAEMVLTNVKTFLDVAVECGLKVPDRRSSVYDELYGGGGEDAREHDKTPTPDSGRRKAVAAAGAAGKPGGAGLTARSMMDLRGAASLAGSDHRVRSGSLASSSNGSDAGSYSAAAIPRSGSSNSISEQHQQQQQATSVAVKRTAVEVLQRLNTANDQLLSVIAGFIGHVHTHTRESHASSFAHLIDMTREAVDAVRSLLVVVEAVHSTAQLQAAKPREMSILFETRESLYEATTALVTAARVITGSPNPALRHAEDDEKSNLLQAATGVLRAGGECVGAVKLCIDRQDASIRIIITEIISQQRPQQHEHQQHLQQQQGREEAMDPDEMEQYASGRRGKNTLSYLGRKATSLNCVRDRYGSDGHMSGAEAIVESDAEVEGEEEDESGSEAQAQIMYRTQGREQEQALEQYNEDSTTRIPKSSSNLDLNGRDCSKSTFSNRLAVEQGGNSGGGSITRSASGRARSASIASPSGGRVQPLPPATKGRTGRVDSGSDHQSDGSEGMSRDHSRTSGSSAVSHQSATTAETSARPSIDRHESDPFNIEQAVPHTAPITGHFQRDVPPVSMTKAARSGVRSESSSPVLSEHPPTSRGRSGTLDPSAAWSLDQRDQPRYMAPSYQLSDVVYNNDKQLIGATLQALVEKLTPHDTTVDPTFSNAFAMCFRLFTTPQSLCDAMVARYHVVPPADVELSEEERKLFEQRKVLPVCLRVVNFLRNWLEVHWQPSTDAVILEGVVQFAKAQEQPALQRAVSRLADLAQRRLSAGAATKVQMMISASRGPGSLTRVVSADHVKREGPLASLTNLSSMYSPQAFPKNGPAPPAPIVSKALLSHLRQINPHMVNVLDFDALELARQLTVMESKLYCAILPEELLGQEFSKKVGVSNAVHVKAMSALSTHITGWISECILSEADARKRRELLKFFIKLGNRCYSLNNFNSLMAIQCALNSSTITRLSKTWDGLNAKYRIMNDQQRRAVEHTRNFAEYRQKLRQTFPPALPFVGLFLTDLTFCHEGNAPTRASPLDPQKKLINFDRYVKVSRIIGELQRYQVPYNLVEVPEIQSFLRSVLAAVKGGGGGSAAEELYRRSLLLEPRAGDAQTTTSTTNSSGAKDIFNWKS
ncbi:ras GEF [Tilletiaria anomala UBC 951]|uniref:Ras GEF n=1 Tax=Tilletiaria anomala (strain ATCC 24038 / CBS 436.72 / UBC 951) TaxID=1037660 RepID=A0A066VY01_TILAU|nr:ras GEF [Tilletiaria anomala UBC 951]KDN46617.1 ras GEF [Tilletiaria anomala UBC 951]